MMMKFLNSLILLAVLGGVSSFKFATGEKQIVQDEKENKSESCQSHQLPMGVYSPWRKSQYSPPLTMAISELALAPVQSVTNQLARAMDEFERDWLGGPQALSLASPLGLLQSQRRSLAPYEGLLLDVKETPTSYEIQIDVPGVKKEDVEVKMHNRVLTIRTERKGMEEQETDTFRRVERYHGTMQRSVTLPESADEDKIKAECVDGVLHVTVHKKEGTQALPEKKIPVEYKETQKAR